jgi:hypothetical protein
MKVATLFLLLVVGAFGAVLASYAGAGTNPTPTLTTPTLPIPDPDPIPEPPPPQPAPSPSPSPAPAPPPSSSPSEPTSSASAERRKAAAERRKALKKKRERARKAEAAAAAAAKRLFHEPRDISVWAASTSSGTAQEARSFVNKPLPSSSSVRLFAAGAFAVSLLLLGIAAIPEWVVRPARAALLLSQWRVQLAASGASALFAALIVFLIGTSRI